MCCPVRVPKFSNMPPLDIPAVLIPGTRLCCGEEAGGGDDSSAKRFRRGKFGVASPDEAESDSRILVSLEFHTECLPVSLLFLVYITRL
jgi:hypothetical protein